MQGPTVPSRTNNVIETIKESLEAIPIIYQAIELVVFHQDAPAFSPSVLPRGDEWPALPACADTAHAAPALTETAASDPVAPAAVRSGKINSNHAQLTDVQTTSPSPPTDQYSNVT